MININKCCGTCDRWQQDRQDNRPASIRTLQNGNCSLDGKLRRADDMTGCWGWKEAGQEEIDRRGLGEE